MTLIVASFVSLEKLILSLQQCYECSANGINFFLFLVLMTTPTTTASSNMQCRLSGCTKTAWCATPQQLQLIASIYFHVVDSFYLTKHLTKPRTVGLTKRSNGRWWRVKTDIQPSHCHLNMGVGVGGIRRFKLTSVLLVANFSCPAANPCIYYAPSCSHASLSDPIPRTRLMRVNSLAIYTTVPAQMAVFDIVLHICHS